MGNVSVVVCRVMRSDERAESYYAKGRSRGDVDGDAHNALSPRLLLCTADVELAARLT